MIVASRFAFCEEGTSAEHAESWKMRMPNEVVK